MSRARPWLRASWLAAAWLPPLALIALPLAIFVAYSFFRVEGSAKPACSWSIEGRSANNQK